MNIRALTAFVDLTSPLDESVIARAGALIGRARDALERAGFAVQTLRLATQPVADIIPASQIAGLPDFAHELEEAILRQGVGYASMGLVRMADSVEYVTAIPLILDATVVISTSLEIANPATGIDFNRVQQAGRLIAQAGRLTDDGFANLRLAALANVRPFAPFFPAAYHGGGPMRFAIATESAGVAVEAVSSAKSLVEARRNLVHKIETLARQMEAAVQTISGMDSGTFAGIDFSLAPYPDETRSVGLALEKLGLPALGGPGSVFATAFLTEALDRATFTRTGFCGLLLPVMEDSRLARRASESYFRVTDLLAYSAVCGTGLDTIPLPGDVTESELAAVLLDVAGLALRLDKQLTARLLPLPGKKAGDLFDTAIEFFAPSRVLDVARGGLTGLLAGTETLDLLPRHSTRQAAAR